MYGGNCRKRCMVYKKIICHHCNKYYIGNTKRPPEEPDLWALQWLMHAHLPTMRLSREARRSQDIATSTPRYLTLTGHLTVVDFRFPLWNLCLMLKWCGIAMVYMLASRLVSVSVCFAIRNVYIYLRRWKVTTSSNFSILTYVLVPDVPTRRDSTCLLGRTSKYRRMLCNASSWKYYVGFFIVSRNYMVLISFALKTRESRKGYAALNALGVPFWWLGY